MRHPDPVSARVLARDPVTRELFDAMTPRTTWVAMVIKARVARSWTQTDLAHAIGVQQPAIAKLESGDRDPKLSTMVSVCQALGIDELRLPIPQASA